MTNSPTRQPADNSIAALFAFLWLEAESWAPSDRATAMSVGSALETSISSALTDDSETISYDSVCSILQDPPRNKSHYRGKVLAIMRLIDRAFYRIHPRAVFRAPSHGKHLPLPSWLRDAQETRIVSSAYYESDSHRLIARGPLSRTSRQPVANNADTLADRFSALELVRKNMDQAGRSIAINHRLLPAGSVSGLRPSTTIGSERIVFIPVAEDANDLVKNHTHRGANAFVDFRVDPSIDVAARIISALEKTSESDIVLAPELVVSEDDADRIANTLFRSNTSHRMVIAGSGQTRQSLDSQYWNEARVLNGYGVELWRQRKVWPAGITRNLALEYGLPDPGLNQIYEDNASGNEIIVVDCDALGRCLILICQDLQTRPLADELIRQYQPDWVFVPIMDCGASIARWAHRRSLELSTLSQARFLISSSLSLAKTLNILPLPPCGLAVGPFSPSESSTNPAEDEGRLVKEAFIDPSSTPAFAELTWRTGGWRKTTVTSE